MKAPKVANLEEWLIARKALLAEEKDLLRKRDELSAKRRDLPWVKVEKLYLFEGLEGQISLADLFGNTGF